MNQWIEAFVLGNFATGYLASFCSISMMETASLGGQVGDRSEAGWEQANLDKYFE
jgi:hypothetical protein